MHGDLYPEFFAEVGCIATVVKIAMGKDDQLEVPWMAACVIEFFFDLSAPVGPACVDEDETSIGFDKVAIDGDVQEEGFSDGFYFHDGPPLLMIV